MVEFEVHPGQTAAGSARLRRVLRAVAGVACLLNLAGPLSAQDLDPRAYAVAPVNSTFLVYGFSLSNGSVLTDPTLPVTDIKATIETPSFGVGRSFGLFGRTAQAFAALPYSWAQVSGKVLEQQASITRDGFSDMRLRLSVLVRGAPASNILQIAKAPRRTIVGTSVTVVAPTGQFLVGKLINLGTHRWAFKPEVAVSKPLGTRWLLDLYAGIWLFTSNDSFYPGTAVRTQEPMGSFQAHVSYTFPKQFWAAFDATYYVGGRSTIDGVASNDRQSNARVGGTFNFRVGKRHAVKLAVSRGAIVRFGANFTTLSVGWQTAFVPRPVPPKTPATPPAR
jgi:hypothetical protein